MEIHVTEFVFNDDIGLIQEAYNRFRYLLFFLSTSGCMSVTLNNIVLKYKLIMDEKMEDTCN